MDIHREAKERQMAGRPANALVVWDDKVSLTTPKGTLPLRLLNDALMPYGAGAKVFTKAPKLVQFVRDAMSMTSHDEYEYKHGWEIQDGDRDGWEYIGDPDAEDERQVNRYRRLTKTGTGPMVLWFTRADL